MPRGSSYLEPHSNPLMQMKLSMFEEGNRSRKGINLLAHLDRFGQNLEQTGSWALPGLELLSCRPQGIQLGKVRERGVRTGPATEGSLRGFCSTTKREGRGQIHTIVLSPGAAFPYLAGSKDELRLPTGTPCGMETGRAGSR